MASRSFAWLATNGGLWALPSNWNDLTDGQDPSLVVPGPQDSVAVLGESGAGIGIISGPGSALFAAFDGNNGLDGIFSFGTLALGDLGDGALLEIGGNSSVSAATAMIDSGSLLATAAGGTCAVGGTLTLGAGQYGLGAAACNLDATNGGVITAAALLLDASSAAIYVDPSSRIEIGGAGTAASGALTIDAGATLAGEGDANSYAAMENNGLVMAQGGNLRVGTVTGLGTLQIGAGATLTLNGTVGASEALAFIGANGTLAISTEFDSPYGTLSGFGVGDVIDYLGSPISNATYTSTSGTTGLLSLTYGGQLAATLNLTGIYTNDVFLTAGDGALGTLILVAPDYSTNGTLSGGTANPDQYAWTASAGGLWDLAANWQDITTGQSPAAVAPGQNDLVTIAGSQTGFAVIAGPADAAALSITGDIALGGGFSPGTLTVGDGTAGIVGTVDLLPGSTLIAATAGIADGALSISGSTTLLSITTTLSLGGGPLGIGLPVAALLANGGAAIEAAALVMGGGSGDYVTTDTTGRIEIGGTSGSAAGAVTIDAGATLSGNGEVNPFGAIVDNGTIIAQGGSLILGSVAGAGTLSIGANAELVLQSTTAVPIDFIGANGTLGVASELVTPTGIITNFVPGEVIDVEGDPITGAGYQPGTAAGTLTLYYANTPVAHMLVAGNYAHDKFVVAPDAGLGTDILVTSDGGGGGSGGQGTTDLLAWTTPGSGAWNDIAEWTDVTTGKPAQHAPGTETPVEVAGASTGNFQVIGGTGACASATFTGDTALAYGYTFGSLTIGTSLATGAVLLASANQATAAVSGAAAITNGTIALTGAGVTLSVAGTLAMGGGAQGQDNAVTLLSSVNQGAVQLGGLTLGGGQGNTVETGTTGSIEIGTLGTAASGAITIDPLMTVSGNGTMNIGLSLIDDGLLAAAGGTLAVGNVTGAGTLSIGVEAVLQLAGTDACPILFAAGGATLMLAGSAETPAGVISGFTQGDAIVTGTSPVTQLAYAPGNGGIGTLSLYFDNQLAGILLLSGNYAGDTFTLSPDGEGTAIGVQQANGGASAGTTTPDDYLWTGAVGSDWNDNGNWIDQTADQDPAAVAPGLNDLDTVQGGTGQNFLNLAGPANAATLTLLGNVALTLQYDVGELDVGSAAQTGLLALGATANVAAADALVLGSIVGGGGALSVAQTLTLGAGATAGILTAASTSITDLGMLALSGSGSAVAVIGEASIEIGQAGGAVAGALTVDPGALVSGAGALDVTGQIVDDGTITAAGGTLTVGVVSGTGTLQIGVGATLGLYGPSSAGIVIDFAGPGTLVVAAGAMPQSAIADFDAGDTILVPFAGITDAEYAQTGAGIGTLTLFSGTQAEAALVLLGVSAGQSFAATASGGETEITTQQDSTQGGDGGMGQGQGGDGSGQTENSTTLIQSEPDYLQYWLQQAIDGLTSYVYTSPDGLDWGTAEEGYANIAVASDPAAYAQINLPPAQQFPAPDYVALLAEGANPIVMTDDGLGNALLVGNAGVDTIVGNGANDTLVGGDGPGSLLWTNKNATLVGNGNDSIVSGAGNVSATTSSGHSLVFLGAADNTLSSNGTDTIIGSGGTIANDTVHATGRALIFAPPLGLMSLYAGAGADTVVCTPAGTLRMYGGAGNGGNLWGGGAGSYTQYFGGTGTATIVGEVGTLYVQGGAGAITVYGGTGTAEIMGTPGPSAFVIGEGASTVTAATGNTVWLVGAANDSLVASGGDVVLWGANSAGNNVFQAAGGPVTMCGGAGNDTLIAGTGAASMTGGAGADIFSFTAGLTGGPQATDRITDFQVGTDLIALDGYAGGIQGVLATQTISGNTTSYVLPDGTHLTLVGVTGLTSASFTGN